MMRSFRHGPIVTIGSDPCSRMDLIRTTVKPFDRVECEWCGKPDARFVYGVSSPMGSVTFDLRSYCSKACRDAHYR